MTLKDKVELYENFLKRIATINASAIEAEALSLAPDKLVKHAFALGWMRGQLNSVTVDAQWTLNQGRK